MYRFSKKILLASQSPRRHALLKQFGIPFTFLDCDTGEPDIHCATPSATVKHFASVKARNASLRVKDGIVLGFDTIVYHNGRILGKPRSKREAHAMLSSLSNATHTVYTGMAAVVLPCNTMHVACEKTKVCFRKLEKNEIKNYINSGEPFDKAGAYGIQGIGGTFVRRICGCFFNVVGLPAGVLLEFLKRYLV